MDAKDRYTKIFLSAADLPNTEEDIKKVRPNFWYNTRDKNYGGLRLTDAGLEFVVTQADIKTYSIPLPTEFKLTPQVTIWLDQFIDSPFHLNKKNVTVLSEKAAFELYLFSGDVKKLGHNKAMAKRFSQDSSID
jgi:hypothetical protein